MWKVGEAGAVFPGVEEVKMEHDRHIKLRGRNRVHSRRLYPIAEVDKIRGSMFRGESEEDLFSSEWISTWNALPEIVVE